MKIFNIDTLFKLVILFCILEGAQAWFFWNYRFTLYFNVIMSFISIIYFIKRINVKNYNIAFLLCILDLFFVAFSVTDRSLNGIIGAVIPFFPFCILLGCNYETIKQHFIFCQKFLSYLFVPSILLHLVLTFIDIKPISILTNDASTLYTYSNYILLVKNFQLYEYRFCSIFLEPGYLGTLCAFMLFADNYNWDKKSNKIILVTLLFSLSLAGYLTAFIGYILINLRANKIFLKRMLFLFCLVFAIIIISKNYNNGENNIYQSLFERLTIDNEKGIKGNNRFSETTDEYFDWLVNSKFFWYGLGHENVSQINEYNVRNNLGTISGAGYKIYLLRYGVIRLFFVFLAYLLLTITSKNKKYAFIFLFIIMLTFIQASYPLSTSWLIPFIFGIRKGTFKSN